MVVCLLVLIQVLRLLIYGNSSSPDQLTSYNGNALTYDSNGNLEKFNGWTYTWTGSQLSTAVNGTTNISYTYDSNSGLRTQKTVNGITTNYTLDANNNIIEQNDGTNDIKFYYDTSGKLEYMTLNGAKYQYETDIQGDVTGLLDSNGNEVVSYQYDTWGNLINIGGSEANTIGILNPFRYRGYYYDTETGLYYLQSRYYNPGIGRFLSQDDPSDHDGEIGVAANLYTYANNNPVMNIDPNGTGSAPQLEFRPTFQRLCPHQKVFPKR